MSSYLCIQALGDLEDDNAEFQTCINIRFAHYGTADSYRPVDRSSGLGKASTQNVS